MPRTAQPKTKPAAAAQRAHASTAALVARPSTKAQSIVSLLKAKRRATLAEMMRATGWQEHSVRGFLAGALKKRHGLETTSEKLDDGPRRYRLR